MEKVSLPGHAELGAMAINAEPVTPCGKPRITELEKFVPATAVTLKNVARFMALEVVETEVCIPSGHTPSEVAGFTLDFA